MGSGGKPDQPAGPAEGGSVTATSGPMGFRPLRLIGRGGFGEVWLAQPPDPGAAPVAVKLLHERFSVGLVLSRFELERRALAAMQHPGIAKYLGSGRTVGPTSRPYFAMEFVDGLPITRHCDDRRLSVRERLRLFAAVCDAIAHAHSLGIIHRDIKPSNILAFDLPDGSAGAKVIDFGIAKVLRGLDQKPVDLTIPGQAVLGTFDYMSPEQRDPEGGTVDTRADVYSLGVLLHELVLGFRPAGPAASAESRPSVRFEVMASEDPHRASRIAASRREEPWSLVGAARGALDRIIARATSERIAARTVDAAALRDEVLECLKGESDGRGSPDVHAPATRAWPRRLVPVLVLAGVAGAIAVLASGLLWARLDDSLARESRLAEELEGAGRSLNESRSERDSAIAAVREVTAEAEARTQDLLRKSASAESAIEGLRRSLVAKVSSSGFDALARDDIAMARLSAGLLDDAGAADRPAIRLLRRSIEVATATFRDPISPIRSIALSPSGQVLHAGSQDGTFSSWDIATGKRISGPIAGHPHAVVAVAASPNGRWVASVSSDGTLLVRDAGSGEADGRVFDLPCLPGRQIAFSEDSGSLLVLGFDGGTSSIALRAGDRSECQPIRSGIPGHFGIGHILGGDISPDGESVVVVQEAPLAIRLVDFRSGRELASWPLGSLDACRPRFSSCGRWIIATFRDGGVRVWDSGLRGCVSGTLDVASAGTESVPWADVDPTGQRLRAVAGISRFSVWDIAGGFLEERSLVVPDHRLEAGVSHEVSEVRVSADQRVALLKRAGGGCSVYEVSWSEPWKPKSLRNIPRNVGAIAINQDGSRIAAGTYEGALLSWDVRTGKPIAPGSRLQRPGNVAIQRIDYLNGSKSLLVIHRDGSCSIADPEANSSIRIMGGRVLGDVPPVCVRPLPDGRRIRILDMDGALLEIDAEKAQFTPRGPRVSCTRPFSLAMSRDGSEAIGQYCGFAALAPVDIKSMGMVIRPDWSLVGFDGSDLSAAAFNAVGDMVAVGHQDGTLRFATPDTWSERKRNVGGVPLAAVKATRPVRDAINHIRFLRDDRTLFVASADGTSRIVTADEGIPASDVLRGHRSGIVGISTDLARDIVATLDLDGEARVWGTGPAGLPGAQWRVGSGPIDCLHPGPDGTVAASAGSDGSISRWDLRSGRRLALPLVGHLRRVRAVAVSDCGRWIASASEDHQVSRWDLSSGRPLARMLAGHEVPVTAIAFADGGSALLSADEDGQVRLWDVQGGSQRGKPLAAARSPAVAIVVLSGGTEFVLVTADGAITRGSIDEVGLKGGPSHSLGEPISAAAAAPGNQSVVVGTTGGTLAVLRATAKGFDRTVIEAHDGAVLAVAAHPDGETAATVGADGTVRLWDIPSGLCLGTLWRSDDDAPRQLAFSVEDASIVVGTARGNLKRWPMRESRVEFMESLARSSIRDRVAKQIGLSDGSPPATVQQLEAIAVRHAGSQEPDGQARRAAELVIGAEWERSARAAPGSPVP
jgi:WD40 repeat protein/serine/threonine protein kinase